MSHFYEVQTYRQMFQIKFLLGNIPNHHLNLNLSQ